MHINNTYIIELNFINKLKLININILARFFIIK